MLQRPTGMRRHYRDFKKEGRKKRKFQKGARFSPHRKIQPRSERIIWKLLPPQSPIPDWQGESRAGAPPLTIEEQMWMDQVDPASSGKRSRLFGIERSAGEAEAKSQRWLTTGLLSGGGEERGRKQLPFINLRRPWWEMFYLRIQGWVGRACDFWSWGSWVRTPHWG